METPPFVRNNKNGFTPPPPASFVNILLIVTMNVESINSYQNKTIPPPLLFSTVEFQPKVYIEGQCQFNVNSTIPMIFFSFTLTFTLLNLSETFLPPPLSPLKFYIIHTPDMPITCNYCLDI